MNIKYLCADGVIEVEQSALREIESSIPITWFGYGGFQLLQRGSTDARDLDLVIFTTNRILLVELKNWKGDIEYSKRQWIHKGKFIKSPVDKTRNTARILEECLRSKLPGVPIPFIESLVVLCHPTCRLKNFPSEESRFAWMLPDLVKAFSSPQEYSKRFPPKPMTWNYNSANPLPNKLKYDDFFLLTNPLILERKAEYQGFQQVGSAADYKHPQEIWSEHRAEHRENRRSKALIRKWNFDKLSGGNSTALERVSIGLREFRLNEMLRTELPELHRDLMEPVGSASPDEVTTNFSEAYRLIPQIERLEELLARKPDMSTEERTLLVQSIFARFSKLHSVGIAHRDITLKTLWVVEPARIILSSFATAKIPEGRTIGVNRVELETGSIKLPEDLEADGGGSGATAFSRDIFLLGVIAHRILENEELYKIDGVPLYESSKTKEFTSLIPWFSKCTDWAPENRYKFASEALDDLNKLLATATLPSVSAQDISMYATNAGPFTLPVVETISGTNGKQVYISNLDGNRVLVKCWPAIRYDERHPSRNRRLLSFLQSARAMRQSLFDSTPEVLDFGMSNFGLVLVTKWEQGTTLVEWQNSQPSPKEKAQAALSLLNSIRRLHALGLAHGDIKASNIIVRVKDETGCEVILLDALDLTEDGDECFTEDYLPPYLIGGTAQQRDLYLSAKLAAELLDSEKYPLTHAEALRARDLTETSPPIDLLAETLERELSPPSDLYPNYVISMWRPIAEQGYLEVLEGDGGRFPVGVQHVPNERRMIFFVTGLRQMLTIRYDLSAERVVDISLKEIGHDQYVTNARRAAFQLHANIGVQFASSTEALTLVDFLYSRYIATKDDASLDEFQQRNDEKHNSYYSDARIATGSNRISSRALWKALSESDELNAARITIRGGVRQVRNDQFPILVSFDLEDGVLDFADNEKIELHERGLDPMTGIETWYRVGKISPDIGKDVLKMAQTTKRKLKLKEGMTFYIRGSLETSASDRRVSAMRRVLGGGTSIPKMADYFDPYLDMPTLDFPLPPLDGIESLGLNNQQTDALVQSFKSGPISLLQGPPGTGKTKFISSFVHVALSKGLAKNILLVSQSHEAVNNALEKVLDLSGAEGQRLSVVRVGSMSMVTNKLKPVHEDSRRQAFRESFDAEIRERVRIVGNTLGLPKKYVDFATEIYSTLSLLLKRIEFVERAQGEQEDEKFASQVARLKEQFSKVAQYKFGVDVSPNENLGAFVEKLLAKAEEESGFPSQEKCKKLQDIFWLSKEFVDVLSSPHSNFTSFLSRTARVVAGTCVGVGKHMLGIVDHAYDWVIVDEAARASPMELVVAMQSARRVLLVGDHLQLPPLYPSAVEEKTSQLLQIGRLDFRRLNNFQRAFSSQYGKTVGKTLLKQYRMADAICRLVSNCFYERALVVDRRPPAEYYDFLPEYLSKQVLWLDTSDRGGNAFHTKSVDRQDSLVNEYEASIVVSLIKDIILSNEFITKVRADSQHDGAALIGVIAMYAAQRDLIRRKLDQSDWAKDFRDLYTVGTVDSYQGKENRIIILSVVRNDSGGSVGFLSESERINVALSRAQDRLIVVSSTSMWSRNPKNPLHGVLKEIEAMVTSNDAKIISSTDYNGVK